MVINMSKVTLPYQLKKKTHNKSYKNVIKNWKKMGHTSQQVSGDFV